MGARDEATGEVMNDRQLRDEVITLFLAGHETTANALAWALYLLATHPEAEERLREELGEVLGAGRGVPTLEDLPGLAYTKMVVDETLRLYPPAWITNRQAIEEDEVLGHRIPAGAFVMRSEEHTSELQSRQYLVCRLLLEKKKIDSTPLLSSQHHILLYS